MARIHLTEQNEVTGAEKVRYDELAGRNAVTNMKKGLLNDAATYDAYMGWYTSWNRLVEVIGEKDAVLYAHAISTTNSCQLCSLFFISDVKGLGLDPHNLVYDDREQVLVSLAQSIVKNPTDVSDEMLEKVYGVATFYAQFALSPKGKYNVSVCLGTACYVKGSGEIFEKLHKYFSDKEIVVIVGFAGQMIATNNFNSVLKIDVDQRLLPILHEFKPATWRDAIK